MTVYDAAMRYEREDVPLIILAGKEYGTGSSRDWAAKGTALLGVRAVIAENFERIHRSNLIGMGVLPLEFAEGQSYASLGLTGHERFDIDGVAEGITPGKQLSVLATADDGATTSFTVTTRIDTSPAFRRRNARAARSTGPWGVHSHRTGTDDASSSAET